MNKEDLIKKWLDHSLNAQELKEFETLEDFDALTKLDKGLQRFKSPEYNSSKQLDLLKDSLSSKTTKSRHWFKQALKIAAIFVLGISIFYYTTTLDTTIATLAAQKTTITLPDGSTTRLNAASTLTYNKHNFNTSRAITLQGEAFFDVVKGSTFNVETSQGTITVLGTQFNVKNREQLFEVFCFEGSVRVTSTVKTVVLKPGESFVILDGKFIAKEKENLKNPDWLNNKSVFKSMPYHKVINEFERQYNVKIEIENVNSQEFFTGSFSHNDIELALKAITLPFNLNYSIKNRIVYISSE